MANRGNKPTKSSSAIRDHLLNYLECSKHYNDNKFTTLNKGRNIYLLDFFYKSLEPKLSKQKFFYNTNLYRLL